MKCESTEPRKARPRASGGTPKIQYLIIRITSIFIYRSHPFHLIICEGKIPDACIFYDVLFVGAAGDCDVACLQVPADNNLSGRLSVSLCNCADCRVVEKCLGVATAAEWEPAFHNSAVLCNMSLHFSALVVWMSFVLQKDRLNACGFYKAVKIIRFVVV